MIVPEKLLSRTIGINGRINHYSGSHLLESVDIPLDGSEMTVAGAVWTCRISIADADRGDEAFDIEAVFTVVEGEAREVSAEICVDVGEWSKRNYVVFPGAVYSGNRFESRALGYPPLLETPDDIGPDIPTIITDVPRLSLHTGPSRIQLLSGDMATPAVGFAAVRDGYGLWLLAPQSSSHGDFGFGIRESADRSRAWVTLTAPGVREDFHYKMATTRHPSDDRGCMVIAGGSIEMRAKLHVFDCATISGLFERFIRIRKDATEPVRLVHTLPFSAAWAIQEEKYNRQNWVEEYGYYSVGMRENTYQDWQTGWVGGLMVTYSLLTDGSSLSKERSLRNLDWMLTNGQSPSGFYYGMGDGTRWYGDGFGKRHAEHWHLTRKSADALYFLMKQLTLLRDCLGLTPAESWERSVRRCANAFVRLWDKYSQFGQFVDIRSGNIVVGGSTCAGICPAGLALAADYFSEPDYMRVAKNSARAYYRCFVSNGLTTGGPGEICQCPDSESAFGLLESFITLHDMTGEQEWIRYARDAANLCASWCMSYDFTFPPESTFGRLDMRTAGSVFANAQNKHSAPGICTLSGVSLFKLFRATGDTFYLELLREIAHNIMQYLSRNDRPVGGMPTGWMNERVNTSDWLEPVGEIFNGSCWSEVSCMLTYSEIPGVYVQPDTGLVSCIDHVDAELARLTSGDASIRLTNTSSFPAHAKVFVEHSSSMSTPLEPDFLTRCTRAVVAPGSVADITLPRL
ncbi:MAG: hypothetical protein M1133_04020 [Armatimonadetes bacterium]|nr:hypothetical protein [Armatimonadota bacterium]